MPRKSQVAEAIELERLEIIHKHQRDLRKKLNRELTNKKATKRLPGEENFKKNMAIFLKIGVPGISYGDIGARIGETKTTVKKWFTDDPHVREQYEYIQANLKDGALELLQFYAIEAIETLVLLMRFGSEKIMKESAVEILDRIGIAKLTKTESDIKNTREHKWADQTDLIEEIRALPPEKQEEAIAGMEKLQALLSGSVDEVEEDELPAITGKTTEDSVDDDEDDDATVS